MSRRIVWQKFTDVRTKVAVVVQELTLASAAWVGVPYIRAKLPDEMNSPCQEHGLLQCPLVATFYVFPL